MATPLPIAANTPANNGTTYATIDPDIYIVNNNPQRAFNLRILDLLQASFMEDTKEQQFLDVGCGTGDFTRDHLLPRCTPLERMVAVDVSEDMVEYAKKNFAHPKIFYDVLDISGNGVADFVERYGQFDRVYSFLCLQRTNNQEAVFKNIGGLLKPGGGCLLLFGASSSGVRLNKTLATMDHWKKYRKVFENTTPPSGDLESRDALLSYMSNLLKNAGLVPTTCELLQEPPSHSSLEEVTANTPANNGTTYATIDPDIYIVNNNPQRAFNLRILDLLQASFMDDTKEQQFLDVGCGTGDFTRDHLLPRCTPLERMVAVDVSEDMVDYAKKNFAHPKIFYDVLDISGNGVADFVERYGQFDRVYSFLCLQRTNNQEAVFKNISGLLKPGGGCLLLFGASSSGVRLNKTLATMDHWKKYRKVFENTTPPSGDLESRDALLSYMSNLLKNAGLVPTTCELLQEPPSHSSLEEVTGFLMTVNCLSALVTEEEKPLLLKDVTEFTARLWAGKEAGSSSLPCCMFLLPHDLTPGVWEEWSSPPAELQMLWWPPLVHHIQTTMGDGDWHRYIGPDLG
ncbi:juvenile hormone acid O-methyltransferase-like [Ixodes scapularis]